MLKASSKFNLKTSSFSSKKSGQHFTLELNKLCIINKCYVYQYFAWGHPCKADLVVAPVANNHPSADMSSTHAALLQLNKNPNKKLAFFNT